MAKRKSLGRGLEALLSSGSAASEPTEPGALQELPVDLLQRGRYQPRTDMREETIASLADSIKAQGLVQPIVARPIGKRDGELHYEIIAGERRWRAAQLAGLATIPTIVRDIPDEAAVAMALIENIQREDLNPLEEARALEQLVGEFAMTHQQAAEAVGRSRAAVTNLLRLLELPAAIRTMLERRELDMGHARALLGIEAPELMLDVARRVVQGGWSVRETEAAARKVAGSAGAARAKPRGRATKDADVRRLETELAERLGAAVSIEPGRVGGRLVIRYHSNEELEGILGHIK
ncbi:MAG TPA: ParB/RepB/Spo0J family partition protein [Gammaproteobacteria bacterium]|nr:ParB/RepB/Spo0J family partition protein [Gammaproteobacteria bacterium]